MVTSSGCSSGDDECGSVHSMQYFIVILRKIKSLDRISEYIQSLGRFMFSMLVIFSLSHGYDWSIVLC